MKNNTICFSGHRRIHNPYDIQNTAELETIRQIKLGAERFLCGMAWGFDLLAAQAVLDLKKYYPWIKLVAVLPCPSEEQTKKWCNEDITAYYNILKHADEVIILSREYNKNCMLQRNDYLVEHSRSCICYLTRYYGGTYYTVKKARKSGLEIINVATKYRQCFKISQNKNPPAYIGWRVRLPKTVFWGFLKSPKDFRFVKLNMLLKIISARSASCSPASGLFS